jgi:GH15 family glucan-1,4-alpha-glucosidase
MRRGGTTKPYRQLLRIVEGVRGRLGLRVQMVPRFDYAEIRPWIRRHGIKVATAVGGNDALVVTGDFEWEETDHELVASAEVRAGERLRLSMEYVAPEAIDPEPPTASSPEELDRRLDATVRWWRHWSRQGRLDSPDGPAAIRSALVLKGLTRAPTGATAAAATTSIPEAPGADRNWDYRYSWIRDSWLAVRSLADLGYEHEADGFRRFVERSAAGHAEDLQIVYGVGGERRLLETEIRSMSGYRGFGPVRVGNAARHQDQHDVFGSLLELAYQWHRRGHSPDDDYWHFLVELANRAAAAWDSPDPGIWETRAEPRHYVHSKVMCWAALERGIALAKECARRAPVRRWTAERDRIRRSVERDGYDRRRGVFVRSYGTKSMDAALLLIPVVEFCAFDDERMIRTTDRIAEDLGRDGLLRRYRVSDGLEGTEGAFLPAQFWLAEAYARQDRLDLAREAFDRGAAAGNDLGLFSEEFDEEQDLPLGNFPQALTHLAHIGAAVAIAERAAGVHPAP